MRGVSRKLAPRYLVRNPTCDTLSSVRSSLSASLRVAPKVSQRPFRAKAYNRQGAEQRLRNTLDSSGSRSVSGSYNAWNSPSTHGNVVRTSRRLAGPPGSRDAGTRATRRCDVSVIVWLFVAVAICGLSNIRLNMEFVRMRSIYISIDGGLFGSSRSASLRVAPKVSRRHHRAKAYNRQGAEQRLRDTLDSSGSRSVSGSKPR